MPEKYALQNFNNGFRYMHSMKIDKVAKYYAR